MIYLLILIYLLLLSYHFDYKKRCGNRRFHYLIALVALICVAGFRYRIGIDTIRYQMTYQDIPTLNSLSLSVFSEQKSDPLYLLLASFCRSISDKFWVLQMAQAILVNTIFFRFFRENTQKYFTAILLYYLLLYISDMTETMRESCAIAMLLMSWKYYKKDKTLMQLLFFVLAFLFHSSAIILILIAIPILLKLDKKIVFSKPIFMVSLLILALSSVIQIVFGDNVELIAFTNRISDKIELYQEKEMFSNRINIFGLLTSVILYWFIPYVCAKSLRGEKDSYKLEFFLVCEMFFAALAFPIFIFYRYINYLMPFVILAISKALSQKKVSILDFASFQSSDLVIWLLFFLPYITVQTNLMLNPEWEHGPKKYSRYYPYSSIFTEEKDNDRENIFIQYIYMSN